MKRKQDQGYTYTGVIFNHLLGLVAMAYLREDATTLLDTLWAMLDPWLSDDLRKLWRRKTTGGNRYKTMMWKVRCCMIALRNIEALPKSNAPDPQNTLVYNEYMGRDEYDNMGIQIAEHINFKDVVMRYLYLFTELIQEGADMQTLHYMIDLGYCFCTPYMSWEEREEWKDAEGSMKHPWLQFISKYRIVMGILDREGLLFARRVVDTTTPWEESQAPDYSDREEFNELFR